MITVVIPVLADIKVVDEFLGSISVNTHLPKEIIFIDNGNDIQSITTLLNKYKVLPIKYIRHDVNVGVNPAWNEGIRLAKTELVSILNNDIIVNKHFFSKVIKAMEDPQTGVIVPSTINKKENIEKPVPAASIHTITKREGWAFTIRKSLLDVTPRIPDSLNIFFGDDWFWHYTIINGMLWRKDPENIIYHKPGASANPKLKKVLNAERKIFNKIRKENRW